jgi:putative membrane protein
MHVTMQWLAPWEFAPVLLVLLASVALLYWRGALRFRVSLARRLGFWLGMALIYAVLQTRFDYYAQHQFFVDRIQQVLLHHLAPLLIMASYPLGVLRAGLPLRWRVRALRPLARSAPWRAISAVLFNPLLATLSFIALVLVWLIPRVMTLAMLDWRLYLLMNWSMLASGLIYWGLVVDHRRRPPSRMAPGVRVLSPALSMTPQVLVGAIITFSRADLYPIFSICGRALDMSVLADQQLGGLITWVPASAIETAGALLALRIWMRLSQQARGRRVSPRAV